MSEISWFKSWHGAPADPKWIVIARIAGVRPIDVSAVVWSMLDCASQSKDRGSVAGYDAEAMAAYFGIETEQVEAIVDALKRRGVIHENRFAAWERRQPEQQSKSTSRVRAFRERQRAQNKAQQSGNRSMLHETLHETGVTFQALHETRNIREDLEDTSVSSLAGQQENPKSEAPTPEKAMVAVPEKPARSVTDKRGSRLPANWKLPDDWRRDAEAAGLPENLVDREADKMRDWSLSAPNGEKKDWRAAWRNWCRNAAERSPSNKPATQRPRTTSGIAAELLREMREKRHEQDAGSGIETGADYAADGFLPRMGG